MKKRAKHLQPYEKVVKLMLDEINLKAFFDYKGGNVCCAAHNTAEAATTAHVFMVQSLASSFKEVAHILPVKSIDAAMLHNVTRKVLTGLESLEYEVICVITEDNAINRKTMSNFCSPPRLRFVYPHPCDETRPLFYIVDTVHLLKCVRNNWINQKNHGMHFYYPKFDMSSYLIEKNLLCGLPLRHCADCTSWKPGVC